MFDGDIRKMRVEAVMSMARTLTVQEMRSVILQLTSLHDLIVMENDPRWEKPIQNTGAVSGSISAYADGMEDCGR
jgi:hypothetical protein